MDFSKKAKEILKKVLHEYRNRSKWDKRSLGEMVDKYLKEYSEEVKKEIEEELYKQLGSFYFINDNPEIAVTPVLLSDMLYKNAKDISKMITKILYEGIKAKETIREIALKIYEGYDFRDEIMKAKKVLPKYLIKALEERDDEIMKQIEKLKTKPLRIAYKDLIRKMDTFTDEELQKLLNTAYHEKMRYYANRIAKTETHRAFMSKRAKDMLEDDEVEFVKYEMSPAHKKTDICDFYANLDVGYGRGVIPKREMRATPLHPHCYCIYTPYYKKVKGKRKKWKTAVKETMSKFSEKKQIEILGSREKLMRFKNGEDIEKIFNAIRPKYPIKKYVDILEGKEYNSLMKKYEEAILKKFENFDVSSKEKAIESFEKLWRNKEKFLTHIEKRKGLGHIENEFDYLEKTLRCLSECEKVNIAIYKKSWDNIYFEAEINNWAVIFNEEGDLMTSYKIDENMPHFLDVHKKADNIIKGVKNELQQTFKRIYNSLKNNTK